MRCLGTELSIGNGIGFVCEFEFVPSSNVGKIAPAAQLRDAGGSTFYGSDGTSDWINVEPRQFTSDFRTDVATSDELDKDYWSFAVGDRINVFQADGQLREGLFTIRSFGDNDSSDPTAADTDVIRVNESITGTSWDATHYVAFDEYSASNTSNMDNYAAMASGDTLPGGDTAKVYG
jgi:hypothetical protein